MNVQIYTTAICPFCIRAKRLLDKKGVAYQEVRVDFDPQKRLEMMQRAQRRTVPQIWVGDLHVGGCDDLYALESRGELDRLLGIAG
ncbi:MAG TPA: glutaredoxin 3 [Pseudomonadales bacterium]|nr:glutaredoxin 3 [Pseudomonadales bacterium]